MEIKQTVTTSVIKKQQKLEILSEMAGTKLAKKSSISTMSVKKDGKPLQKKLDTIAEHNETLAKLIKEKNSEIADLKRSTDCLNDILISVPNDELQYCSSVASHKLVEMSNENRKLNAELITTKSQLNKKDVQMQQREREIYLLEQKLKRFNHANKEAATKANIVGMERHMEDLRQVIVKTRLKNAELSSQLQLALKCLQQETGNEWELSDFVLRTTNWTGRAEKIQNLEQQLSLRNIEVESYKKLLTMDDVFIVSSTTHLEQSFDSAEINKLKQENASLKSLLELEKSKSLTLQKSNETLNEELMKAKSVIDSLEERSICSNENLNLVNNLVHEQQTDYEARLEALSAENKALTQQCVEADLREKDLRQKLNAAEQLLSEKYSCIEKLIQTNRKLESDLKSFCGDFLFSCRDFKKEEFVAALGALETEKEHLLKKIKSLEQALELERSVKTSANYYTAKEIEKSASQCDSQSVEELQLKLKFVEQTNDDLQARIERLIIDNKQQLVMFEEMLAKSKETILDTIRQYRGKCNCNN